MTSLNSKDKEGGENNERYQLVREKRASSTDVIKRLAKGILLKEGIDITRVNIKEEGVTIECFTKLVNEIYMAGWRDGEAQYQETQTDLSHREARGEALSKFKWKAKETAALNLLNK